MVGAPVKPGDILAGKYRVERVLGIGGMGVVVAATHLDLLELRALKFMIPTALSDAEAAPRFQREARAAARLKSEHVAKVYDVGRLDDGAPYMVMEYLEGRDLDALLKAHSRLPPNIAALYALQVCSALAEAHSAGIVHRDLKPANLFLTGRTDGSPCIKVLDFGISKVITPGAELDVTKTQQVLGSPLYMSPEQMRSTRSIDARSDIWSMGVILYKMMTGKVPFMAQSITELVALVLEASPVPPSKLNPALPPGVDAMILRCLRRAREERYANVVDLASDLANFAPPGATAAVEAMARVVGAAALKARSGSFSAVVDDPNQPGNPRVPMPPPSAPGASGPSSAPATAFGASPAIRTPALASATPIGVSPAATGLASSAELTTATWGQTATRLIPRSNVTLVLVVILILSGLAGAIGIFLLLLGPPASDTGRASATAVPSSTSPATETTAAAVVTSAEIPAPPTGSPVTAAPPSTGEAASAEAPTKEIASAKPEPPSKTAKDDSSAKGKTAPVSTAKPAPTGTPTGKSMLGGAPVF